MITSDLSPREHRLVARAVRNKRVFVVLSILGVLAGAGFAAYFAWGGTYDSATLRVVVVVLILLNARSNLRQYRYARVLERLISEDR